MKFKSPLLAAALMFVAQNILASVNIFIQPQSQTVAIGSNAVFTASTTTTGGETITGYTWLTSTNSSGPFSTIAGATGPVLTITNAQISNNGFYFVRVNYQAGGNPGIAVSTAVTLSVQDQARVTGQPVSLTRAVGATASFTVTAAGEAPLGYQWRFNGTNLGNDARISGANSAGLAISNLSTSDTGNYDVIVTNSYSSATSQVAVLTVLIPPAITVQPGSQMALVGDTVTLSASVSGSAPLSFRWRKGAVNLSNSGRISGATTNALVITGALTNDTGLYTLVVTNAVGSTSTIGATLTVVAPVVITSATNVIGRQGVAFNFNLTASGSAPITFGSGELPSGLSLNPTNGLISGTPSVTGIFDVSVNASNAGSSTATNVTFTITEGAPGINSSLIANGKQGLFFNYTIAASNNPTSFSASQLPLGLNFNAATGQISGTPIESGLFPITIGVANQYGSDNRVLLLNLASAVPVITSPLTIFVTEGQNFTYTITASNSPTYFNATGLPLGLVVNPTNGIISGAAAFGGTNDVVISARNAWGTGTNTLQIRISYAPLSDLVITDVTWTYSKPFLLDFTFSLRDSRDPAVARAVVRPVNQLQVVCQEGSLNPTNFSPIGNETAFVISPAITANAKQLKTFFVMDYSYSMFIAPPAIGAMETAVKGLIDQEPPSAQFAINEFNADYVVPALVIDFTSDKMRLHQAIDGIQTNFVKGNHAGSRLYDALNAAILKFGPTNNDEQRYIVVMSDGNDDSSTLTLPPILAAATNARVQIYCVGFGVNVNTTVLQQIATRTGGRYFPAASVDQIAAQFALLLKDLNAQYFLRWATLQRGTTPFQPSFEVTVDGLTAKYNADFPEDIVDDSVVPQTMPPTMKTVKIDRSATPPITNELTALAPNYVPNTFSNNVQIGELRLVGDAMTNASSVTLRAFYVPRYVREFKMRYRANYPCTPLLLSAGPGDILSGWSLTETNDGTGTNGNWLTLSSPDPTNVLTSLPYGIRGDLIKFQFEDQAVVNPKHAFSLFQIDNSIYTNFPPSGQSFTLTNTNSFITVFAATPTNGTPVPWLIANGFSNNFAVAELTDLDGDGLLAWQEYLAGLNPNDPNSTLALRATAAPGQPNQITFRTVVGKTYRVEAAVTLGNWINLQDGINGTGGDFPVLDGRNLSGVSTMFYRIAVY